MSNTIYRPTQPQDVPGVIALAEATGLFPPEGLASLRAMLDAHFASHAHGNGAFWVSACDGEEVVGVAYCEPERMTDRTWNIQFIAVHPSTQRTGRGSALLAHVLSLLRERAARVVLVDTSGQPSFEYVRSFYRKAGFVEEARIRDFYQAGDDKVTFWRALGAP